MLLLPASATRSSQPQGRPLTLNRNNPLGAVLDNAWLGNDLSSWSIGGGIVAPPPAGTVVTPGAAGKALANTGAIGSLVPVPALAFPYLQIGLGYFNNASGNWSLSDLGDGSVGYASALRLNSANSVHLSLRYNFGTVRTLALTVGSGVNSGRLLCCIAQVLSDTDYRLYCAGLQANGSSSPGTMGTGLNTARPPAHNLDGGLYLTGYGVGRSLSDAQALQITNNPQSLWDIFKGPERKIFLPSGGSSAALQGNASAVASANGALSVAVPVVGAAIGVASASGQISTAVPLAGVAAAASSAAGILNVAIALSGGAVASAAAAGAVQIAVALSGSAVASAAASGNLLSGSGALAGAAVAQAAASGALSVSIPLAGNASVLASASGALSVAKPLAGAAVAVAAASGSLTVTVILSGSAMAQAIAAGGLSINFPLSGAAVAHALASGALSGGSQAAFVALGQSARIGAQKMDPSHRRPGADSVFVRARRPGGRYLSIGKRRIQ